MPMCDHMVGQHMELHPGSSSIQVSHTVCKSYIDPCIATVLTTVGLMRWGLLCRHSNEKSWGSLIPPYETGLPCLCLGKTSVFHTLELENHTFSLSRTCYNGLHSSQQERKGTMTVLKLGTYALLQSSSTVMVPSEFSTAVPQATPAYTHLLHSVYGHKAARSEIM